MPSCLTPKEKADVLIKAHQLVVGELDEERREGNLLTSP